MSTSSAPVSNIPLWGQAYELSVKYVTSDGTTDVKVLSCVAWEPEALRIRFEVMESILPSPWWFADMYVYNLTEQEIQNAVLNAVWVTLKAGFQKGSNLYSTIWSGPVMQTTWTRENVVDTCVRLHCVANPLVMNQIVAFSMGPYSSQAQLLARLATTINLPPMTVQQGTVDATAMEALSAKQYPRGNTVFGKAGRHIGQIADDQLFTTFRDGQQAYVTSMSDDALKQAAAAGPQLVYAPPYPLGTPVPAIPANTTLSLIGTPQQIPQGVMFTVLLDPRLKVKAPPMVVKLDRVIPTSITFNPGETVASPLSSNLTFFVAQVRHIGDSRGNEWYTEVLGFSTAYGQSLQDGVFGAAAAGG